MNTFGIQESVSSWYGGLVMGLIAVMSIHMVAMAIVRLKFFRRISADSRNALKQVQDALSSNNSRGVTDLKNHKPSDPPVRILAGVALDNRDLDEPDLQELLKVTQVRQRERLNRGLSVFGTYATIGPFLGLFATVLGIIESFHNLAQSGEAGPNVVASGVAAALWGTAAGLALAIPAVIAYNVFNKMAKSALTDMEVSSRELVLMLKAGKRQKIKAYAAKEA
jgi:biopolymer transport protein ExbB